MNNIKEKFTETEWRILVNSPMGAIYAILYIDGDLNIKEFNAYPPILEQITKDFSQNSLVQTTFAYNDSDELAMVFNALLEASTVEDKQRYEDIIAPSKARQGYTELASFIANLMTKNPKINNLILESNHKILSARMAQLYLMIPIMAKIILDTKNLEETKKFLEAIYKTSEDLAKAYNEHFLNLGKSISNKEAKILELLKENIS